MAMFNKISKKINSIWIEIKLIMRIEIENTLE